MKSSSFLFFDFILINSNYKFIIPSKMFHKQCLHKFQLDKLIYESVAVAVAVATPTERICLWNFLI